MRLRLTKFTAGLTNSVFQQQAHLNNVLGRQPSVQKDAANCKGCSLQILMQIVSTLDEHDLRQMWRQCLPEGMICVSLL